MVNMKTKQSVTKTDNTSLKSQLTLAAECLRVLAHPDRLLMLRLIRDERLTVGALAQSCAIAPHAASQHLRLLMRCGLLRQQRIGAERYYEIAEPHLNNILQCIETRFLTTELA